VTGSFDKTVKVWDTNSEQEALKFDVGDHVYGLAVQSMAQTHSLLAVACGDQRVALLDMASGGRKNTLLGHRGIHTHKHTHTYTYIYVYTHTHT
jgi:hypothetical protein